MGIVNGSSYGKENSETIEIAPIPPNLFTDISAGKSDLSTEISLRINDEHEKQILNGFVQLFCPHLFIRLNIISVSVSLSDPNVICKGHDRSKKAR